MITITEKAQEMLTSLLKDKEEGFRISVQGGGCSGLKTEFTLTLSKEQDKVINFEGGKVLIDPKSSLFIQGSVLDYKTDLNDTGFKLINPNSKRTCGCGESFSL